MTGQMGLYLQKKFYYMRFPRGATPCRATGQHQGWLGGRWNTGESKAQPLMLVSKEGKD